VWDSSAKSQAGLCTGNLNSLGNFDECVSIRDVYGVTGNFGGKYCLATLNHNNISEADTMGKMLEQIMQEEEKINIGVGKSEKIFASNKESLLLQKAYGVIKSDFPTITERQIKKREKRLHTCQ
jgi:hypothetical protein